MSNFDSSASIVSFEAKLSKFDVLALQNQQYDQTNLNVLVKRATMQKKGLPFTVFHLENGSIFYHSAS